jgi:hypothetical protein
VIATVEVTREYTLKINQQEAEDFWHGLRIYLKQLKKDAPSVDTADMEHLLEQLQVLSNP